jgi:hypothetical protein
MTIKERETIDLVALGVCAQHDLLIRSLQRQNINNIEQLQAYILRLQNNNMIMANLLEYALVKLNKKKVVIQ